MTTSYISELMTTIDLEVNHFTFDAYHAVVSAMFPTLTILLVLYFAGLGWLVIRGLIPITPMTVGWHMLKASLVFLLATHWSYFSLYIVDVFTHGPDRLLGPLLNNATANGTNSSTETITAGISHFWQTGNNVFANLWRVSGTDFLLGTLFGFAGYAVVTSVTAIALFYIMMSKIALSVLLVLAPLILPLFLWENTRAVVNGWLRLLIKWGITPLFIYVFLTLYLNLLQNQVNSMANATPIPTTASISIFILLGLVVIGTLIQGAKMATGIASQVNIGDLRSQSLFEIPAMVVKTWRQGGGR